MASVTLLSSADIATIVASVVACAAFIVSTLTYMSSTKRERKIKTLDYWETAYSDLVNAKETLTKLHKGDWTEEVSRQKVSSDVNLNLIIDSLNKFEHLATGINFDIYDLKVINKLGGKLLTDAFIAYTPLIAVIENNPSLSDDFPEFKSLYSKLDTIRKKAS
jgi:hypothetical protein